jgi:uncharacterized protein (DUF1778 family)
LPQASLATDNEVSRFIDRHALFGRGAAVCGKDHFFLDMYAHMAYMTMNGGRMSRTPQLKRDRMHLRLDARTKRKLERAAAYEETSVSDFVLANAVAAAERVIDSREKITFSAKDWDIFYDALVNPPEPNERLKKAARRYRERVGG